MPEIKRQRFHELQQFVDAEAAARALFKSTVLVRLQVLALSKQHGELAHGADVLEVCFHTPLGPDSNVVKRNIAPTPSVLRHYTRKFEGEFQVSFAIALATSEPVTETLYQGVPFSIERDAASLTVSVADTDPDGKPWNVDLTFSSKAPHYIEQISFLHNPDDHPILQALLEREATDLQRPQVERTLELMSNDRKDSAKIF